MVKAKGSEAVPLVRDAVPSVVLSETKVTFPVGFDPVTVAVKVSCCAGAEMFAETTSVIFDGSWTGAVGVGLVWFIRAVAPLLVKAR